MPKVYIVLSQTGTLFSRVLRYFTKDQYNHSSLSFDRELTTMYSFGRRSRYNFLNSGFILENFDRGLFRFFPEAQCQVLEVTVTKDEYQAMQDAIADFNDNVNAYHYNIIGILGFAFKKRYTRKHYYFCSQFVSHILQIAELWNQSPEFTKPVDFHMLPHLRCIYEGPVQNYVNNEATSFEPWYSKF